MHAPIFPLPTVNLFPETTASYHIFEPRYVEMIESVLEGGGLLAMGVLKPGYEEDYYGTPEIFPVGCLGKIQSYEKLENGKYNIVLEGLFRVGFGEIVKDNPFRVAELIELPESDSENDFIDEREDLLLRLNYLVEQSPDTLDFSPILGEQESFIALVNLVARTLPLKNDEQYALLSMDSVRERANRILWLIDDQIETIELLKRVDPRITDDISLN
ncbi:MAG: LON peptidase substrate-binding domain-containing protein [FCB group bacterium]|nr:LON peptidase substrate-binding domain-containing protein [FCB group bacterium]MBL7027511.1 LON peptidase substrate-binding domain-containing protein [Candidatus Neomarinimicrobiota bacterium]MBL7122124.1 LON peptidase substrate-binding domain-containing protein [Candidatus Neomarinimicrobiota bacterium]